MSSGREQAMALVEGAKRARRQGGDPLQARRDLQHAVALLRQEGSGADLAEALKSLGQVERDLGRSGPSAAFYEEAAAIYRELGDLAALAHTLRHVADVHIDVDELDAAAEPISEVLSIYRQAPPDALEHANAFRIAAMLSEKQGAAEALPLWLETKARYQAADGVLKRLTGGNPGVDEAEGHIARLS